MSPSSPPPGRVLALGDVHGCARALDGVLAAVAPRPGDLVIALGDLVDRGPDSRGVLERLLALRRRVRLVAVRGNHEEMMLDARAGHNVGDWLACGGRQTLASYNQSGAGGLDEVPAEHWDFLENDLVDWYETPTHFFVHAGAYPELELDEQPGYMLRWEPFEERGPHVSGKIMVCGHTPQKTGLPRNVGHAVCIDTWVYGQGWLTCLEVGTGRLWQANQSGRQRSGWLEEPAPEED